MSVSELDGFNLTMARFKSVWEAGTPGVCGYVPQFLWPDKDNPNIPRGYIYAKLAWSVVTKKRRNIGQPAWYVYNGSFFVIVLQPLSSFDDQTIKRLAELMTSGFQGQQANADMQYREVICRPFPAVDGYRQYRAEIKFEGNERS